MNLDLGPDVVARLLPHGRPFLMVDRVSSYERSPRPSLVAHRHVSSNEAVFEGHFRSLHLWPGVYTIEGMGQSCNLLGVIGALEGGFRDHGRDPDEVIAALRNLELGHRLLPSFRPEVSAPLLEVLGARATDPSARIAMSVAVDVKLLAPVFAGQRIDYRVTRTHIVGELTRFEVEADVSGRAVARGSMSSAMHAPLPNLAQQP